MSDTASERAEALRADSDASRITHPQVQEERMSGSKNGELRSSDTLHNSTSSDRAPPPHVSPVKDKSSQPPLVNTDSKQPPRGRPLKALGHADAFPFQGAPVDGLHPRNGPQPYEWGYDVRPPYDPGYGPLPQGPPGHGAYVAMRGPDSHWPHSGHQPPPHDSMVPAYGNAGRMLMAGAPQPTRYMPYTPAKPSRVSSVSGTEPHAHPYAPPQVSPAHQALSVDPMPPRPIPSASPPVLQAAPPAPLVSADHLGEEGSNSKPMSEWLMEAIETRNKKLLQMVLAQKQVNLDEIIGRGDSYPIITASKLCHTEILEMLIEAGANVNVTDKRGWTALHWAAVMNNVKALQILCNGGADVQPRTHGNKTALDLASLKNHAQARDFLADWCAAHNISIEAPAEGDVHLKNLGNGFFQYQQPKGEPPRRCVECSQDKTPQWRRGPDGSVCLCNACGLRFIKANRKLRRQQNAQVQQQAMSAQMMARMRTHY